WGPVRLLPFSALPSLMADERYFPLADRRRAHATEAAHHYESGWQENTMSETRTPAGGRDESHQGFRFDRPGRAAHVLPPGAVLLAQRPRGPGGLGGRGAQGLRARRSRRSACGL